jgi:predicted lipoprotein with Yx(FWY)xxD motif
VRILLFVVLLVTATSCSGAHRGDGLLLLPTPDHVVLRVRDVPKLGAIVADGSGRTLYMFPPDASRQVTCTGPCAGTWPPLTIARGDRPTAGPGIVRDRLGTMPDPNSGADVITYDNHPLYRYAGDVQAGTANGQALFANGGPWYVLSAQGLPVTTDAS